MPSIVLARRVSALPDRPVRPVGADAHELADGRQPPAADVLEVAERALRARATRLADAPAATEGRAAYAERAYRAVSALRARPASDVEVEVAVRSAADGARLAVARRLVGGATVGIEARVG